MTTTADIERDAADLLEALGDEQRRIMEKRNGQPWRPGLGAPVDFHVTDGRRLVRRLRMASDDVITDRFRRLVERGELVEVKSGNYRKMRWRLAR